MVKSGVNEATILRDLGDGLLLRRAEQADAEALVAFNTTVHGSEDTGEPDKRVGAWVRDLMEKPHPTFSPEDFTVVEEKKSGKIVSSLNLISQTWTFGGIPFGVGRPELVGTLPEYRNRGLVRAQFDVIHSWSQERGEKLQAITGIPYYYRLFGYEMGLALGGGRAGFTPHIPKIKEGEQEPYVVRPASLEDVGFIDRLYRANTRRYLVSCQWDEELWRYEITGKSRDNANRLVLGIVATPNGETVGLVGHPPYKWGSMLAATFYELKDGISWSAVTPTIIRYLKAAAADLTSERGDEPFEAFGFWLGSDHPVYKVLQDRLPRERKPYAWYIRVADLPSFILHITPALEDRLARSPVAGHSGELKITFYTNGLRLVFEKGRLAQVEAWRPMPQGHSGVAAFPNLTFLQLLFGYRSLEELKYAFADCWTSNDEASALLNALFPKQLSNVWPVS